MYRDAVDVATATDVDSGASAAAAVVVEELADCSSEGHSTWVSKLHWSLPKD